MDGALQAGAAVPAQQAVAAAQQERAAANSWRPAPRPHLLVGVVMAAEIRLGIPPRVRGAAAAASLGAAAVADSTTDLRLASVVPDQPRDPWGAVKPDEPVAPPAAAQPGEREDRAAALKVAPPVALAAAWGRREVFLSTAGRR
ncbi:MAG TPA: hypothetical protein VKB84_06190 [Candidatus Binataceae bacterium]|nr:hypothetical protein [Candidatus Binataceae bacterium]